MAQRYIYLSDELNNRLKSEENVSALIVRLLNEHYKYNEGDIEEKRAVLTGLLEEKKKCVETFEKDIEKMQTILEKKENEKQEHLENQKIMVDKVKRVFDERNRFFKDITGRDMTQEEYKEFSHKFDSGEMNLILFADEIRLKESKGCNE